MMTLRQILGTLLLVLLLALGWTPLANACAVLDHGDPRVGSTVETAPSVVTLFFSSGLQMDKSTLEVTDVATGKMVSVGKAYGKPDDPTIIEVKLAPRLPPGKYKVKWNVLCQCGNYTPGDYKFTIGG